MLDNPFQKFIFHLTSLLTTYFPRFGAWFFNTFVPPIVGSKLLIAHLNRKNEKIIRSVKKFEKILVIPDIHLGDAILAQGALKAFRDFFPDAQIDYIVNKTIGSVIDGNPDISNLYPVFIGGHFPKDSDIEHVKRIAAATDYDLCFNCSPFFEGTHLFPKGQKILNFLSVAPQIVRYDIDGSGNMHIAFNGYDMPFKLLSKFHKPKRAETFTGVPLTLTDRAINEAAAFFKENKIDSSKPVIFFNPDTASPYTRIPVPDQAEILKQIAKMDIAILLGAGFTAKDIEKELLGLMNEEEKKKVIVVPTKMTLDGYGALIDLADVFISGDTGPLHIAAARKMSRSGQHRFRNKTFIISVFGATPPALSGYDSNAPLYLAANQGVLSKTYISESPCRNITCVNKMAKTCKKIRCYESLDTGRILADIRTFLKK